MGRILSFRSNWFIRMEVSAVKEMPIAKQVTIQPVSSPMINQ